ncbi:acid protease, partial [Lichtheimia hyalospora FSU 10163]
PLLRRQHSHHRKRDDSFSAQLYNAQGSEYLVQVAIGTPPQNFTVTLDTGSGDLWVPSTACPTSECPYSRFDESASSTFKNIQSAFNVVYGIGSVNGTYATDTVTIGGVSVQNQQFGLGTSTSDILTNPTMVGGSDSSSPNNDNQGTPIANGILGLGYPALTASANKLDTTYNPFVFNLVEQNLIQQHLFSVYMNSASADGWAGEVIFGGVDSSKYTGNITYVPVAQISTSSIPLKKRAGNNNYYYWMVHGQGIQVSSNDNHSSAQISLAGDSAAFIIDTGTTLTYFPNTMADQIASALVGNGNYALDSSSQTYIVECKKAAQQGTTLELEMSDSSTASNNPLTITVPVSQLVIPLDSNSIDTAMSCMLGIAPLGSSHQSSSSSSSNMILIGDSVLRTAYLVFDIGNNQVGFATANNVGGTV